MCLVMGVSPASECSSCGLNRPLITKGGGLGSTLGEARCVRWLPKRFMFGVLKSGTRGPK
jgi:hypothetical protein